LKTSKIPQKLNKRLINNQAMKTNRNKQTTTESRDRILHAAVTLFARQGYGNTGLRELAVAADVNLAMINYFFGSKKKLLKEILDIFFSGYLQIAKKEMDGRDALPAKLHRFIHRAINYFATHQDYLLVTITELPHDDPEITEHKAAWGRQMAQTLEKYLQAAENCTESQRQMLPPITFCSMLTSMMASRFLFAPVMAQVQPAHLSPISIEEYANTISTVFLQGVTSILCPPERNIHELKKTY
jgi:AcrR family transcriptional regulator